MLFTLFWIPVLWLWGTSANRHIQVILEETSTSGVTDSLPMTLFKLVVLLEKRGLTGFTLTGHKLDRPSSVKRGESADAIEVEHQSYCVYRPSPVQLKTLKQTNMAGYLGFKMPNQSNFLQLVWRSLALLHCLALFVHSSSKVNKHIVNHCHLLNFWTSSESQAWDFTREKRYSDRQNLCGMSRVRGSEWNQICSMKSPKRGDRLWHWAFWWEEKNKICVWWFFHSFAWLYGPCYCLQTEVCVHSVLSSELSSCRYALFCRHVSSNVLNGKFQSAVKASPKHWNIIGQLRTISRFDQGSGSGTSSKHVLYRRTFKRTPVCTFKASESLQKFMLQAHPVTAP